MNDRTSDNAGVITIPPIVYLVGLLLGLLIHYFYPIGFLSESVSIGFGVLLTPVAIPIALFAVLALKRAETPLARKITDLEMKVILAGRNGFLRVSLSIRSRSSDAGVGRVVNGAFFGFGRA